MARRVPLFETSRFSISRYEHTTSASQLLCHHMVPNFHMRDPIDSSFLNNIDRELPKKHGTYQSSIQLLYSSPTALVPRSITCYGIHLNAFCFLRQKQQGPRVLDGLFFARISRRIRKHSAQKNMRKRDIKHEATRLRDHFIPCICRYGAVMLYRNDL
jgi:hypothetical protein